MPQLCPDRTLVRRIVHILGEHRRVCWSSSVVAATERCSESSVDILDSFLTLAALRSATTGAASVRSNFWDTVVVHLLSG